MTMPEKKNRKTSLEGKLSAKKKKILNETGGTPVPSNAEIVVPNRIGGRRVLGWGGTGGRTLFDVCLNEVLWGEERKGKREL